MAMKTGDDSSVGEFTQSEVEEYRDSDLEVENEQSDLNESYKEVSEKPSPYINKPRFAISHKLSKNFI
jgi:hypothetical protein